MLIKSFARLMSIVGYEVGVEVGTIREWISQCGNLTTRQHRIRLVGTSQVLMQTFARLGSSVESVGDHVALRQWGMATLLVACLSANWSLALAICA